MFKHITTEKGEPLFLGTNYGFFEKSITTLGKNWIQDDSLFVSDYGDLEKSNFKINSKNYRSDEFTTTHTGLHVLFSGCSHAFGVGLLDEERWSELLYNNINRDTLCSGYFNIAKQGYSIKAIIINIFKYIEEFGKPDVIFFGVPEINRSVVFVEKHGVYKDVIYQSKGKLYDNADLYFEAFHYYKMLELFCKYARISLISFDSDIQSVDIKSNKQNFKDFDTYYDLDKGAASRYIYEYSETSDGKFDIIARDGLHYGIAVNKFIAEKLYSIYRGIYDNSRNQ